MAEVDPVLASIIGPARNRMAELESEIDELEKQLAEKREQLRPYRRVLNAASLNGKKPGPKPSKASHRKDGSYAMKPETLKRIETVVRERFADSERFGPKDVHEGWPEGQQSPSRQTIGEGLNLLHAGGVLRLLPKRSVGGGKLYRVISQ